MTMDDADADRPADRPTTADQGEFTLETARAAVRAAIEQAVTLGALDNDTATQLIREVDEQTDVDALHQWVQSGSPKVSRHICAYPHCFHPRRQAEGAGKPPSYCVVVRDADGDPAHNAQRSMRARAKLKSGGRAAATLAPVTDPTGDHPIARARYTAPDLVDRVGQMLADQQAAQVRALSDLRATIALLGDDEAMQIELESRQNEYDRAVKAAENTALAAEKTAREANAKARLASDAEQEAIAAAEEALEHSAQVEAAAADRIAAAERQAQDQAEADAERVRAAEEATQLARSAQDAAEQAARAAVEEVERIRREAADQVKAAQDDALEHQERTIADRDRLLAERQAELDAELVRVRAAAEEQVKEANKLAARAEQAAADARTDRDAQAEQVREVRAELATVRKRAQADADQHRSERERLDGQLREMTEKETSARVELATTATLLDAERTGRNSDRLAADQVKAAQDGALEQARRTIADQDRALSEAQSAATQADTEVRRLRDELEQLRRQPPSKKQ